MASFCLDADGRAWPIPVYVDAAESEPLVVLQEEKQEYRTKLLGILRLRCRRFANGNFAQDDMTSNGNRF